MDRVTVSELTTIMAAYQNTQLISRDGISIGEISRRLGIDFDTQRISDTGEIAALDELVATMESGLQKTILAEVLLANYSVWPLVFGLNPDNASKSALVDELRTTTGEKKHITYVCDQDSFVDPLAFLDKVAYAYPESAEVVSKALLYIPKYISKVDHPSISVQGKGGLLTELGFLLNNDYDYEPLQMALMLAAVQCEGITGRRVLVANQDGYERVLRKNGARKTVTQIQFGEVGTDLSINLYSEEELAGQIVNLYAHLSPSYFMDWQKESSV